MPEFKICAECGARWIDDVIGCPNAVNHVVPSAPVAPSRDKAPEPSVPQIPVADTPDNEPAEQTPEVAPSETPKKRAKK